MPSSYWNFCFVGPDGTESCTELYADLGDHLDDALTTALAGLGDLDQLAGATTDATLLVGLVETLDAAVARLAPQLPDGAALRRADRDTFFDAAAFDREPAPFDGVPGVVGMTHVDGFNTLRAAGYQVKTVWEWTSPSEENTITDQSPQPGAQNAPPTLVYIWVRTLPPEPVVIPDPVFLPE